MKVIYTYKLAHFKTYYNITEYLKLAYSVMINKCLTMLYIQYINIYTDIIYTYVNDQPT